MTDEVPSRILVAELRDYAALSAHMARLAERLLATLWKEYKSHNLNRPTCIIRTQ